MRANRLLRLVLAATLVGAVGVLSFLPHDDEPAQVEWSNADQTNPEYPPESPSPSYDGDGTSEPDGDAGEEGPDGSSSDGAGEPGEPENVGPEEAGGGGGGGGGLLGLSFPVQAGMSIGVLALAFLALLPGRRMPQHLR